MRKTAHRDALLGHTAVFPAGGDAAADMPLCLVFLQNLFHLKMQRPVIKGQTLLNILMYGGFGNAEFLGRVAHGGAVFDDVGGQLTGALLDVTFQDPTRSLSRYTGVYAPRGGKIQNLA